MFSPTLLLSLVATFLLTTAAVGEQDPTEGIVNLVRRRLPDHVDKFLFSLNGSSLNFTTGRHHQDAYTVSTQANGSIHVEGNSRSALAAGYLQLNPTNLIMQRPANELTVYIDTLVRSRMWISIGLLVVDYMLCRHLFPNSMCR